MNFSKLLLLLLLFCVHFGHLQAQKKSFSKPGKITLEDFDPIRSKVIDSNVNAVVLSDVGSTNFIGDKRNWFSYVFKKTTRIKIINQKAFDLATVKVRLYGTDWPDKLSEVQGTTYNLENGKVVESRFNPQEVYEDKLVKGVSEKRFTMPAVKEGSIVEYTYTVTSYHYHRLPTWFFQYLQYPCLYSEYEIAIPTALSYIIAQHGADSFFLKKSTREKLSYSMQDVNVSALANRHTWVMKEVPAFKLEPFIYSPSDYLDKIEFHLSQTYNGRDLHNIMTSWDEATNELLNDSRFGAAIPPDDFSNLVNIAAKANNDATQPLESAKNIYSYIRDNFTCIEDNDIYARHDLYDVNKNKKGSVAEINLLLIALLRHKAIIADPVILSTRSYGSNPADYPVLDKMNYVVCRALINGETFYLDATRPLLAFGRLPLECYNGHARIISKNLGASVFFQADSIKEQKTTFVTITNESKGGIRITYQSLPGLFKSDEIRKQVRESGPKKFFDNFKNLYGTGLQMTRTAIDSLNKVEYPVRIFCEWQADETNNDIVYFSPVIESFFSKNPFKSAERIYPVHLPYPINEEYVLSMQIPAGYEVDELPKSVKVNFNGDEGFFQYLIQNDGSTIQLRSRVELNRLFLLQRIIIH